MNNATNKAQLAKARAAARAAAYKQAIKEGRVTVQIRGDLYGHIMIHDTVDHAQACLATGLCVAVTRHVAVARITGCPIGSVKI